MPGVTSMPMEHARAWPISSPPIHPFLACILATCFTGAFLTDLAYWRTAVMIWADFSAWMITAGVILAWLFAIAGVAELIMRPSVRQRPWITPYALGSLIVLLIATFNMLIHSRDTWVSVVPTGVALSGLTVLALIVTAWFAALIIFPPRPGVTYQ
ncbi:MAG: hypothetical protein B7Y12_01520 [Rhizobiales bacterium 24-66-13]|nr:MAG: hypothetical protein B7Y61_01375 [Rhizobiales bacterium 35-66-30]OYZ82911.1 MAG: hypothetical protein B7Y12_01520 [Rhizobiales bacterium 24-66-13]OZB11897.1 MAG: hypothetical protein B7X67_01705 [Rhizobiales bacterium 39-66-18]